MNDPVMRRLIQMQLAWELERREKAEAARRDRDIARAISKNLDLIQTGQIPDPIAAARPGQVHDSLRHAETAVYRAYSTHGYLLYVGIAKDVERRMADHRRSSPWFVDAARIDIKHYPNRWQAENAEREAIRAEQPIWNVVGNSTAVIQKRT
jgi:predicted GIY-YIG superfamily endonuclease